MAKTAIPAHPMCACQRQICEEIMELKPAVSMIYHSFTPGAEQLQIYINNQ